MGKVSGGAGRGAGRRAPGTGVPVAAGPIAPAPQAVAAAVSTPAPTTTMLGPSQVTSVNVGGQPIRSYKFDTTAGDKVSMSVVTDSWGNEASVSFAVNGSAKEAGLPQDVANAVSLRLMRHMREDARTRPNGFKYSAYAQEGDSKTTMRAIAYQAVGMSRPLYGRPGNTQFAVVKNGKMTPDDDRLRMAERTGVFDRFSEPWNALVDNFRGQRNSQR